MRDPDTFPNIPAIGTGLVETGYVVADLDRAVGQWRAAFETGPFEIHEAGRPVPATYRGRPVSMRLRVGLARVGALVIELIQVMDDTPSVYLDTIRRRGYGFHHWGLLEPDYDAALRRYVALGVECIQTVEMPGYGRVAYIDTVESLGGMIELFEDTPHMRALFAGLGLGVSRQAIRQPKQRRKCGDNPEEDVT